MSYDRPTFENEIDIDCPACGGDDRVKRCTECYGEGTISVSEKEAKQIHKSKTFED